MSTFKLLIEEIVAIKLGTAALGNQRRPYSLLLRDLNESQKQALLLSLMQQARINPRTKNEVHDYVIDGVYIEQITQLIETALSTNDFAIKNQLLIKIGQTVLENALSVARNDIEYALEQEMDQCNPDLDVIPTDSTELHHYNGVKPADFYQY